MAGGEALITGLKISNLLTISPEGFTQVGRIVEGSVLSLYPLLETEEKMVILLYREDRLEKYLKMPQVKKLLRGGRVRIRSTGGYFAGILQIVMKPIQREGAVPPRTGLLLGYPPEDVEGFIRHQGKNSLCTGYWKVYADKEGKQRLFEKYEYARENLIQLLHYGLKMTEIIDICGCTAA